MQARESTGATTRIIQALSHNIKQKVVTVDKTESLKAQRNSYLEFWSFFLIYSKHIYKCLIYVLYKHKENQGEPNKSLKSSQTRQGWVRTKEG